MEQSHISNTVGILGYGEVGKAMAKFYPKPKIKDLTHNDGLEGVDVLHVCIPWNETFIDIVVKEVTAAKPKLVVIHSTVASGTTKKLVSLLPDIMIVHSPVRGVHPHLYEGIQTFVKYIGTEDKKAGLAAQKHLRSIGIKTKIILPAAATELGKLLDTTYYGVCIAFHGEAKKMCDEIGVNFDDVMTKFNETYNKGYAKLGKKHVVRPVLYPPKNGIGGHCVVSNAYILKKYFKSAALDFVLEHESKNSGESNH